MICLEGLDSKHDMLMDRIAGKEQLTNRTLTIVVEQRYGHLLGRVSVALGTVGEDRCPVVAVVGTLAVRKNLDDRAKIQEAVEAIVAGFAVEVNLQSELAGFRVLEILAPKIAQLFRDLKTVVGKKKVELVAL